MKLLWKEKKKECDTEQQGACLKTQFKPPTVVQFSCAGRGSSSSWIQATKRAWQNHRLDFSAKGSAEADLLAWHPFPWQQQIELSWLPCGGDRLQKSTGWSCSSSWALGANEDVELYQWFPSWLQCCWGQCPKAGCWKRVGGDGAVESQAGTKARLGSQYLLKDILMCSDFLQTLALLLKHNYSSSPLFDCYLLPLAAYVEAAAYVGLDRQLTRDAEQHTQFSQACTDTLYQRLCSCRSQTSH